MGRPLNKKYFGNRNIGSTSTTSDDYGIGGQGLTVALGGTNNSTGFTNNSTTQVTVTAPDLPKGVQAVIRISTFAAGALTNATTYSNIAGTGAAAGAGSWGSTSAPLASTSSGSGTGATFTVVKTSGGAGYNGRTTVTLVGAGSGYALADTITIAGTLLGGASPANDLTFDVATFVATTGTIQSVTVTEAGSGYTTAPTVTFSTGTKGTLTATASLTVDSGNIRSATNQENAILMTARLQGGSAVTVDIIKQVSGRRYKVTDGTRTGIVKLKSSVATAVGEASVRLVDNAGGTYFATKITSRKALITRGTGVQTAFPTGASVKWNMTAATADSLLIDNG